MKNANLVKVFDQLGMPAIAQQARGGRDMSLAVSALVNYDGASFSIRGEAEIVRAAASKDGYDMDAYLESMGTQWITMPYSASP